MKPAVLFATLVCLVSLATACNLPAASRMPSATPPPVTELFAPATVEPPVSPSPAPVTAIESSATPLPSSTAVLATVTVSVTLSTAVTPPPIPSPPPVTQYRLEARLDYPAHSLAVTETITYPNLAPEALTSLLLVVESNRRPGQFTLMYLAWGNGAAITAYTLEGARLTLPLDQPLQPGEVCTLRLRYNLLLPAAASPLGYTARQTNLGNWFPFIPPYDAQVGWLAYAPSPVGEHLVYAAADFDLALKFTGAPKGMAVAASSPGLQVGETWRYTLSRARTFTWSASPEYVVSQTQAGDFQGISYALPEHAAQGETALQVTAQAAALYSELFRPYPYPSLSVVEADFFDGMEYDGLYFLGSEYYAQHPGSPQGYLTALAAHETAHQWWYSQVGNDQAVEPWLDEALCTYSERLYYERYHPELVDWWWRFRVNRFEPWGWVDSTIYTYGDFRSYVNAVYLRGALFLEDVRQRVGDEVFFAFLKDYAAHSSGQLANAETFFTLLQAHSLVELDDLLAVYFTP